LQEETYVLTSAPAIEYVKVFCREQIESLVVLDRRKSESVPKFQVVLQTPLGAKVILLVKLAENFLGESVFAVFDCEEVFAPHGESVFGNLGSF
jgi:hypothetical protein